MHQWMASRIAARVTCVQLNWTSVRVSFCDWAISQFSRFVSKIDFQFQKFRPLDIRWLSTMNTCILFNYRLSTVGAHIHKHTRHSEREQNDSSDWFWVKTHKSRSRWNTEHWWAVSTKSKYNFLGSFALRALVPPLAHHKSIVCWTFFSFRLCCPRVDCVH